MDSRAQIIGGLIESQLQLKRCSMLEYACLEGDGVIVEEVRNDSMH